MLFFCWILISEINLTMIQKLIIFVIKVVFFWEYRLFHQTNNFFNKRCKKFKNGHNFFNSLLL